MQVCTNAVVRADKQGIASLMDRLARLVSRQAYGHQAMVALRASVEHPCTKLRTQHSQGTSRTYELVSLTGSIRQAFQCTVIRAMRS